MAAALPPTNTARAAVTDLTATRYYFLAARTTAKPTTTAAAKAKTCYWILLRPRRRRRRRRVLLVLVLFLPRMVRRLLLLNDRRYNHETECLPSSSPPSLHPLRTWSAFLSSFQQNVWWLDWYGFVRDVFPVDSVWLSCGPEPTTTPD